MDRISKSPNTRHNNKFALSPSRNKKQISQQFNNSQLNQNSRSYSTRVLKQSKRKMMLQSSFQNLRYISLGLSDQLKKTPSFDFNQQKKMIQNRSTMIAQGIYDVSLMARQGLKFVEQKTMALHRNLNIISRYVYGYPKIVYVPLIILTSSAYGFHSVKKTKSPYLTPELAAQESPLTDFSTFKKWVVQSAVEQITEVVANKDVKKEGVSYLEKMFKNKQVHGSLVILLKGAVKDQRFVTDSKKYGIDWISYTITSHQCKQDLKDLMQATFVQDKRVVQTSTDLLKYFVSHSETREMTKNLISKVCLTDDVLRTMAQQLGNGGYNAVQTEDFQDKLVSTMKEVVYEEKTWADIKQRVVYQPLADTFTFGLYSKIKGIESNQSNMMSGSLQNE